MRNVVLAACLVWLDTWAPAGAAGFRVVSLADPGNPPIEAGIWYPSDAAPHEVPIGLLRQNVAPDAPVAGRGLGLIAFSHGTSGWFGGHYDTAIALADAGFVVVAPTHTGDNYKDRSRQVMIWDRARQLHVALDYMLAAWPEHDRIDPKRIGAFGFSAGGFTVLVAAGGVPDMGAIAPHCAAHVDDWTCKMIAAHRDPKTPAPPLPASVWVHDGRIKAVVVAAPALGYTFGKTGLAGVDIPVQLWRADEDKILPQPFYAQAVADDLPKPAEYHVVPNAGHLDFLAPCSDAMRQAAPETCVSLPDFDRAGFHETLNHDVVAFFERTLPKT